MLRALLRFTCALFVVAAAVCPLTAWAQFNGTYYINNTGSGPADYTTLQDAITALTTNGASGNVTFDITGTFEESFTLPAYPQTATFNPATDAVVFKGQGLAQTTIERLGTNSPAGLLVEVNGATNIVFKDLFLRNVAGGAVVQLNGATQDVRFQRVKFFGLDEDLLVSAVDIDQIEVEYCQFEGQDNIRITGDPASGGQGLKIHHSTFLPNSSKTAIKVSGYSSVEIYDNTITGGTVGIELALDAAPVQIYNNQIYGATTGMEVRGVLPVNDEGYIVNNRIRASSRGLSLVNAGRYEVLHNSVQMGFFDFASCSIDPTSTSRAFNVEGALSTALLVRNNVFASVDGGYSTYVGSQIPSTAVDTDGNNLYNWGKQAAHWRGTDFETLFAFQQASGTGTNEDHSVNCDPQFTSSTDFHSNGFCMDGAGVTGFYGTSHVSQDIDGDARATSIGPIDIGADEFTYSGAAKLAGSYTIGSGGTYASVAAALADLRTRGVAGAVTFSVQPGTYAESNWFVPIDGATDASRITFTGSTTQVSKLSASQPVKLCGRLYMTFERLTLASTYAGVNVPRFAREVILRNNSFTTNGAGQSHIAAEGGRLEDAEVRSNLFAGEYTAAINLLGPSENVTIANNAFTLVPPNFPTFSSTGIHVQAGTDVMIEANTIDNVSTGMSATLAGASKVLRNTVNTFSTALYITMQGDGTESLVANNMLHHTERSGNAVVANLTNAGFHHNTVYLSGSTNARGQTTVGGGAAFLLADHAGASIYNNLFVNEGGGPAAEFQGVDANAFTSDHNLFLIQGGGTTLMTWITPSSQVTNYTTLANFQSDAVTGTHEDNSISKAVSFVSSTDLHLSGASVGDQQLAGTHSLSPAVPTDIDAQTRSTTKPYLGADEASTSLPVELASFDAQRDGTAVVLRWATASETNNEVVLENWTGA